MCNDIGEAAYVDSLIAAALLDAAAGLPTGAAIRRRLGARYGVPWAPSLSSAAPLPEPPARRNSRLWETQPRQEPEHSSTLGARSMLGRMPDAFLSPCLIL